MVVPGPDERFKPMVEEISAALDPWQACRRLACLPHLLFLDSACGPAHQYRFSFVTADPFRWLQSKGRRIEIIDFSGAMPVKYVLDNADPFDVLEEQLSQFAVPVIPHLPPFQGGAAGMFGYELCHHLEKLPSPEVDDFSTPDLAIGFYDWALAFDHLNKKCWIISTGLPEAGAAEREKRARQRIEKISQLLTGDADSPVYRNSNMTRDTVIPVPPVNCHEIPAMPGLLSNFDRERYLRTIRRAVEYVHAGDCFQVNIAQRLLFPLKNSPLEVYASLRSANPAPFAGYFDLGEFQIASASPERFVFVNDGCVSTLPIKGTRPRGANAEEETRLKGELLRSEKDRAENVMIVDLLRNDLGRVCQYGSVTVADVCRLETYEFVHHLVSEVQGKLRPDKGPVDLLRASFPGGSVTGAPKIRAMEIIAELERVSRGPYTGCLGYIGFDGTMDTNILIRTFTFGKGWIQFPVGGGIVADSNPESEYEETWHKAKGLVKALEG